VAWYFIASCAGGAELVSAGLSVLVLTPQSPLGGALTGLKAGGKFKLLPEAVARSSVCPLRSHLTFGVLQGISLGFGYIVPVYTVVTWFPDRPRFASGITDRHSLFTPRHEFFSLDAGALN